MIVETHDRFDSTRKETIELIPGVQLEGKLLRDLNLNGVDLRGSTLRNCFFNESSMIEANLTDCVLDGSVFYRTNLSGADLTGSSCEECHWNEAVHDERTIWPAGVTQPVRGDALSRVVANHLWPTGWASALVTPICSAGLMAADEVEGEVSPRKEFVGVSGDGTVSPFVSPDRHAVLFGRLALNIFRAGLLAQSGLFFGEDAPDEYAEVGVSGADLDFSCCVLALLALGLRIDRVIDEHTVEGVMRPTVDMREFVKGDAFRAFRLGLEVLFGREIDEEKSLRDAIDDEDEFGSSLQFSPPNGSHFDVSEVLGGDGYTATVVEGEPSSGSPEELILRTLVSLVRLLSGSDLIVDVDGQEDDEENDENTEYDLDEDTYDDSSDGPETVDASEARVIFGALGLVSAEWVGSGIIKVRIRPPMDHVELLAEEDWSDHDELRERASAIPAVARPVYGMLAPFMG